MHPFKLLAVSTVLTAIVFQASAAEPYPIKPVRLLVGFPAGGSVDKVARLVAKSLSGELEQQFVVDNRAGAHGIIAAELAARAAPDGYTLLVASGGHSINPALYAKLPYDTQRDFFAITQIASYPMLLLVHPSLPVHSTRQLISLAKSKPGALNYASTGPGSTAHLTTEMFRQAAGIDMTHIPYKGGAPALTDLVGGQVQVMFNVILVGLPHVKAGRLRGLGVTSIARSDAAPDLPTLAESGLKGFETESWTGLLGPARLPKGVIDRLHAAVVRAVRMPDVMQPLRGDGANIVANSPKQFASQIEREIATWAKVVQAAGVRLN